MKRTWKSITIALFCFVLAAPLILQGVFKVTGKRLDVSLNGYFEACEKPELTLGEFASGNYQPQYEKWLNANVLPRGVYIKLYNQIRYSFFDIGSRIIGKNKNLFEEYNIISELCINDISDYSIPQTRQSLEEYVAHLESIQNKLKKVNKQLLVYTTPIKTTYDGDDIPMKYRLQERKDGIQGIKYFKELIQNTPVNYLDTEKILESRMQSPVFYTTGEHWSRPAEQWVSKIIIDKLAEISGKKLRNIELGDLNVSDEPYWRDAELYELLNIYADLPKQDYYEYQIIRDYPEACEKTKVLLQGGSFAQGLAKDYFDQYASDILYYINYNNYIQNPRGEKTAFSKWEEVRLEEYLNKVDFVVIELNYAAMHMKSSGFVEYLDNFLDDYIDRGTNNSNSSEESIMFERNFEKLTSSVYSSSKGVWEFEDNGIAWATDSMFIKLRNKNISEKGISIELEIPEQNLKNNSDSIIIYVNQKKTGEFLLTEPGRFCIDLDINKINRSSEDLYEIEILCQNKYNPSKIGESLDNRDLAVGIYYIGEKR